MIKQKDQYPRVRLWPVAYLRAKILRLKIKEEKGYRSSLTEIASKAIMDQPISKYDIRIYQERISRNEKA